MASKRGRDRENLLDNNGAGGGSLIDFDQSMYGAIAHVDAGRQVAEPISIFEIYPDLGQPRRTIPSDVRQGWDGLPDGVPALLDAWLVYGIDGLPQANYRESVRLMVQGESGFDYEAAGEESSAGAALRKLVEVAAGIYRDGLINPITVARAGLGYRLETGERRWLAYHLLHLLFEGDEWAQMPARVVETPNVWRQAAENNARDNLNAIARARQLAILIIDVLGADRFHPLDAFESEREYYAQVADGDVYRIPRGQTERLLQAMGLKDGGQVRQYRRLLRLPDAVWRLADDENWTEGKLRNFIPNDGDSVTTVTVGDSPTADMVGSIQQFLAEERRKIEKIMRKYGAVGQGERRQISQLFDEHRRWLEKIERGE